MKILTEKLKQKAHELGFQLTGVALAAQPARLQKLHEWLDAGMAANMLYIDQRRAAYQHPTHVLDGCKSLLMLGLPYLTSPAQKPPLVAEKPGQGLIARYAQGDVDYHDVIHGKLKELKAWLQAAEPEAVIRGVVDTAPLLEREFAELAGLGWVGKNTLLLNPRWGSYFFLAALLTDLELTPDASFDNGHCGTCTACLTHCPTNAFPAPYVLDANRCLSYLTIEHREPLADDLAEQLGDWVFGCDICQEVCPWNRKAHHSEEPTFAPEAELAELDLLQLLAMDEQAFREHFRQTPLWRTRRRGLLRNAILVAGNQRLVDAQTALLKLLQDEEPLLRGAAAWSLARIAPGQWCDALQAALANETDADVRESLKKALAKRAASAPEPTT